MLDVLKDNSHRTIACCQRIRQTKSRMLRSFSQTQDDLAIALAFEPQSMLICNDLPIADMTIVDEEILALRIAMRMIVDIAVGGSRRGEATMGNQ